MRTKIITFTVLLLVLVVIAGCAAHVHNIGEGTKSKEEIKKRQWYILWGLVELNEVDTAQMAGEAKDYTIVTQQNELDTLINIFGSMITLHARTVTVEK